MKLTILAGLMAATSLSVANAADLRMSWWGGDSRHLATQEALKYCGEKLGHTISPEFTGWSGHQEKITTQLAGGTEADIMQINWPWLPLFTPNGEGFADLNEYSDIIDLSQWTDAELATSTVNGHLQGLPLSITGRLPWFNQTTFEKAGLSIPTTWDELEEAGKVFKEKLGDDYYPYEATGSDGLDARLLMTAYLTQKTGKTMIDPETLEFNYTMDEMVDALEMYKRYTDEGVIIPWPKVAAGGNLVLHENPAWADGHIAGTYQWDTVYFKISDPLQEGQVLVPSKILLAEGATNDGVYRKPSMLFSISRNSDNGDAAAEVVNCLLNDEGAIDILGTTRGIPASKKAFDQLTAEGAIEQEQIDAHQIILDATGPTISPYFEHPQIASAIGDTLEEFAYGQIDAETAADDIIYNVNDVLDRVRN
ncbi:oligogalacturonide transport system substrate-binding protein [Martelella radicis]|uniref:Oligogalacturonide transport system substrate-binding protein n=2 Tax=Martelella radicis TaxID=1397476 RepID=A0A7W6KJ43_9HYPH|nr:ABC transporter substrate-binding protein [Martelella radicis]MBB4120878.1 oligogalacturonide transport system substrate-binding protein [Martelella radicis]